jgi:hypothetical protein
MAVPTGTKWFRFLIQYMGLFIIESHERAADWEEQSCEAIPFLLDLGDSGYGRIKARKESTS